MRCDSIDGNAKDYATESTKEKKRRIKKERNRKRKKNRSEGINSKNDKGRCDPAHLVSLCPREVSVHALHNGGGRLQREVVEMHLSNRKEGVRVVCLSDATDVATCLKLRSFVHEGRV